MRRKCIKHQRRRARMLVNQIDQELIEYLSKKASGTIGTIHSIFDRVINVLTLDESYLISIASKGVIQAPMMMQVSEGLFLKLKETAKIGDPLTKDGGVSVKIKEVACDYEKAQVWLGKLSLDETFFDQNIWEERCKKITAFICKNQVRNGLSSAWLKHSKTQTSHCDQNDIYTSAFCERLHDFKMAFQENSEAGILQASRNLIGLGVGLTPSGDDFLLGCLATWQCFNKTLFQIYEHDNWISEIKNKTTMVSYYMLKECHDGFVNDALFKLLATKQTDALFLQNLELFLNIGATSGKDMLVGVLFAMKYINTNQLVKRREK